MGGSYTFDLTDTSENIEGKSVIDVAVDLGPILFASAGVDTLREGMMKADAGVIKTMTNGDEKILSDLFGPKNENTLMRVQLRIPTLCQGQIHQAVTVISE